MYKDCRIRNASRSSPVPPNYRAWVFRYPTIGEYVYKVVLAPSMALAYQRIQDYARENDLDCFWVPVCNDDFEIIYPHNIIPK